MKKAKLFRTSTIALSLDVLLRGQLRYLSEHFDLTAVSGADEHLDAVRNREGVRILPLRFERQISPLKDLVSLIRLYLLLRREKPDIIHSITPKAGLLSMLAGKAAGVPIRMHTFTGLVFPTRTGVMQKILIAMDRVLCWAATNIYPEGQGVKNDLVNYKITDKPLTVLANGNVNGIDLQHFDPATVSPEAQQQLRNELGITENDFVFVFVGRLVGDKGINELVSAFSAFTNPSVLASNSVLASASVLASEAKQSHLKLNTQHSTLSTPKLLLVGPLETDLDPLRPDTLKEIETHTNIISVGFQNDVRPYFAISDALVFPSYREGFPNVVMQAGAMGLPSIVTDINGCNEIVIDGENGLIIPAKDAAALATAMQQLMSDNSLNETLKEYARPLVESRYKNEVVWEALLSEYDRLIAERDL